MIKFLRLAWRNMWRNWRRTSIALVAIVVGLVLLLFMDGLIDGSDQAIYGNAVRLYGGNVQVHAPGYRARASRLPLYTLENPDEVVQATLAQPQVIAAAKRIQTAGIVSSNKGSYPVVITAIEPDVETPISIQAENTKQGRFLLDGDGAAIVIGRGLAEELALSVGDRLTLLGRSKRESMRQHSMTVVGIYDLGMREAEKNTVFITLPEAQMLYNLRDQVTEVSIMLESVGQEQTVMPALQAALPGYEVDSWDTLKPELQGTMDTKLAFTSFFGLVVVGIACIGILNILMMAVFERTREMGVLAALGMKNRQLMGLFLLEGTLIGAFGAFLGCLLGGALLIYLRQVGMDFSFAAGMGEITALMGDRIYPTLSLVNALNRSLTVVMIAALASLYPAWQAAHKEPAAALHQV